MSDRRSLVSVLSAGVRTKANDMSLVTDARPLIGGVVRDWFPGAWQQNMELQSAVSLTGYAPFYACASQISGDIAKLALDLMALDDKTGIENRAPKTSPFWQVLRKPNRYQNRIQFIRHWVLCKLIHGNAYALKGEFDQRGICTALYLLDPRSTRARITPEGDIYYSVSSDLLAQLPNGATAIPQRFILHDRGPTFWDPLVGVSPFVAAALSGSLGMKIQRQSAAFFGNMSRPSGIITGPDQIPQAEAQRLKDGWRENYSGLNVGNIAVLGDKLTYQQLSIAAEASQLAEQLGIAAVDVATAFGMPAYMINQGPMPTNNNVEALRLDYYMRALQVPMEEMELLLTEGLQMPDGYSAEFNLDGLLRMDTSSQMTTLAAGVKGMILKPNEARAKLNLEPVKGGDTVYGQHQDYSVGALDERDRSADPFGTAAPPAPPPAPAPAEPAAPVPPAEDAAKAIEDLAADLRLELELA